MSQTGGEHIALTQEAFDVLPEYSTSLPTGTTIGKQWKTNRGLDRGWKMGEYIEHPDPELTGICWKNIVIRKAGLKKNEVVHIDEWASML